MKSPLNTDTNSTVSYKFFENVYRSHQGYRRKLMSLLLYDSETSVEKGTEKVVFYTLMTPLAEKQQQFKEGLI